eukprot:CAMPEP_0196724278 /NCGR_PEP_ID=MMETSP1091-20130531/6198_1 /TAXON_ID=302021 /ORGANISM="Rhodomonas sp., Strain CCMP768" /LENGTH=76 /DNA_ID=CAMNT_0042066379 /DNA_START=26 /DNA_END=252 /DNA_ORIENTATION=+
MKHVAAYMLAVLGGKESPTAEDLKTILAAVDAKADDASLDLVIKELSGKDIATVIAEGSTKLVSMGGGGGGGGGGG